MRIRLELRDKSFNIVDILDNEYQNLKWSYSRIGGCGEFSFSVPRKIYLQKVLAGEYNVRIYYRESSGTYTLWYQGLIDNKSPSVKGNSQDIAISGHGYVTQLSRIYVNATYTSTEISEIVKDILDTYVTPNTDVSYSAGDVPATSFTPSKVDFNDSALVCIQKLADMTGTREWGVDADRNFYFKARSSSAGFIYYLGNNITGYSERQDFGQIINRIYVQGAESGGTYYFSSAYNDAASILKYNLRERVLQNSSITTADVAENFAEAYLSEFNDAAIQSNFELVGIEAKIEATTPISLVNIVKRQDRYGQKKYNEGIYCGKVNHLINRVNYSVANNNTLKINIDIGKPRPTLSEQMAQIEYELEQQRSAAL